MGIEKQAFISKFTKVFKDNGFGNMISLDIAEIFFKLTERMLEENEKYNLTAITDVDKIILSHYAFFGSLFASAAQSA